ncbi:hypothetical protein Tco_1376083 [Tanacetum coccineum]
MRGYELPLTGGNLLMQKYQVKSKRASSANGVIGYGGIKARWKGVEGARLQWSDKEVTKQNLVTKMVMKVLARLLGDMIVMS